MQNDYKFQEDDVAHLMKYRNNDYVKHFCLPFDQALKRKVVIRQLHPENDNIVRIYVQGAPESVVNLCKYQYNISDA
jgi:magnesium-transporting ATPase (P-type)